MNMSDEVCFPRGELRAKRKQKEEKKPRRKKRKVGVESLTVIMVLLIQLFSTIPNVRIYPAHFLRSFTLSDLDGAWSRASICQHNLRFHVSLIITVRPCRTRG